MNENEQLNKIHKIVSQHLSEYNRLSVEFTMVRGEYVAEILIKNRAFGWSCNADLEKALCEALDEVLDHLEDE